MNIFVLDLDARQAARYLCDKHVVKMVTESAQLLSTVAHVYKYAAPRLYRPTHAKHPCTLWAQQSKDNCLWLWEHADEMCLEYTRRYGRLHGAAEIISNCRELPKECPDIGKTAFALAMPEQYKTEDAVRSYRRYYLNDKVLFAAWKTGEPAWWRSI